MRGVENHYRHNRLIKESLRLTSKLSEILTADCFPSVYKNYASAQPNKNKIIPL